MTTPQDDAGTAGEERAHHHLASLTTLVFDLDFSKEKGQEDEPCFTARLNDHDGDLVVVDGDNPQDTVWLDNLREHYGHRFSLEVIGPDHDGNVKVVYHTGKNDSDQNIVLIYFADYRFVIEPGSRAAYFVGTVMESDDEVNSAKDVLEQLGFTLVGPGDEGQFEVRYYTLGSPNVASEAAEASEPDATEGVE